MSEFKRHRLADLYEISSGISTTKDQAGHGAPFVAFKDIYNNYFIPERLTELMDTTPEQQEKFSVRQGDVFLTRTSETLDELAMSSVALQDHPNATCSGFAKRLRPRDPSNPDPRFMGFFLRSEYFRRIINSVTTMTTRASFNEAIFSHVEVDLPDLDSQVQIGDLLYSIEQQIELNNQVNDNLQAMLQTLYGYWFLQFDFPDKNGQPYRASGGRMVWNDQLKREIPAGWRAVTLRELLKKNRKAFDYGTVEPTIDLSVMPTGSIALNNLSRSDAFSSNLYQMSEGDILFGAIRPYLKKAGIAPCNGVVAGTVHSFSPVRVDDYNFALATITSEQMFSHAVRSSTGTRMPTVKADDLLDVVVAYSESVATAFNQIPVARSIIERVQESSRLGELRDWLLPLLMNGQATVTSSDNLSFT